MLAVYTGLVRRVRSTATLFLTATDFASAWKKNERGKECAADVGGSAARLRLSGAALPAHGSAQAASGAAPEAGGAEPFLPLS